MKKEKSVQEEKKISQSNKTQLIMVGGVAILLILFYSQIVLSSQQKWFHAFFWFVIVIGLVQAKDFFENQNEIDGKLEELRKSLAQLQPVAKQSQELNNQQNHLQDESSGMSEAKSIATDLQSLASSNASSKKKGPGSGRSRSPELQTAANKAKREKMQANANQASTGQLAKQITALTKHLEEQTVQSNQAKAEDQFNVVAQDQKTPITRICLTGGPCAGKTTALAELQSLLQQMGYRVLLVPRAQSIMKTGAGETKKMSFIDEVKHQTNLMRLQMNLEDIFIEIASTTPLHTIIICDRGTMDGSAYVDENVWQAILDETGWSTIQLRDRRYEAVIHMVTAAEGAQEFFLSEQNTTKESSIEEARLVDQKLMNAWAGHPSFNIIKNTKKGFETKIQYCCQRCLAVIGAPYPTSRTKKFLLATDRQKLENLLPSDLQRETFLVEETFIKTSIGQSNLLRKTGKNDSFTYQHEMRYEAAGEHIKKKRGITAREFIELLENQDENRQRVKKTRQCFIYEQQYYIVESFDTIKPYPSILRLEMTKDNQKIKLPPYLPIVREVTAEKEFETWFMANGDYTFPEEDGKAITEMIHMRRRSSDNPSE